MRILPESFFMLLIQIIDERIVFDFEQTDHTPFCRVIVSVCPRFTDSLHKCYIFAPEPNKMYNKCNTLHLLTKFTIRLINFKISLKTLFLFIWIFIYVIVNEYIIKVKGCFSLNKFSRSWL